MGGAVDPAVDEDANPRVEVLNGRKDSPADCLAFDDAEPDLSQVHSRGVSGPWIDGSRPATP